MKLCTIGSNGKGLRKFAELITQAGVDCVIDVRLNNTSQLAGYSKKDDLEYVLELLGIGYQHHPELAPSEELFAGYQKTKDWDAYIAAFERLIEERGILAIGEDLQSRFKAPCLLCSEDDPTHCHRRLIAEHWALNIPGVEVQHLK